VDAFVGSMVLCVGLLVLYLVWMLYMATFRTKDFVELTKAEPSDRRPFSRCQPLSTQRRGQRAGKFVVMALCALYILSPLDVFPDVIPVLGWGDDIVAGNHRPAGHVK